MEYQTKMHTLCIVSDLQICCFKMFFPYSCNNAEAALVAFPNIGRYHFKVFYFSPPTTCMKMINPNHIFVGLTHYRNLFV